MCTTPAPNRSWCPIPARNEFLAPSIMCEMVCEFLPLTQGAATPRIKIHLRGDYAGLSIRYARDRDPLFAVCRTSKPPATCLAFHAFGGIPFILWRSRIQAPNVDSGCVAGCDRRSAN